MRDQSERVAERVRQVLRDFHSGESAGYGGSAGSIGSASDGGSAGYGGSAGSVGSASDGGSVGSSVDEPMPTGGRGPRARAADLAARLPVRIDPGRGTSLAVGVAVVVAALVTGGWLLLQRPASVPVAAAPSGLVAVSATPVGSGAPTSSDTPRASVGAPGSASATELVVDVAGKVRRPGLYRLPPGARIDDAVRAAGGSSPGVDLSPLNLAQKLVDGQQVVVGAPAGAAVIPSSPAASAGSGNGGGSAVSPGSPVNLNSATLEELETLPGVGPVLAQHILDWRTEHGSFTTVGQLDDVSGIGTVKFAALQPLVTV